MLKILSIPVPQRKKHCLDMTLFAGDKLRAAYSLTLMINMNGG